VQYVRLGHSSLQVSRIGLGAMGIGNPAWRPWVLPEADARPIITRALDHGVNFFDTCDFYSGGDGERVLGRVLKECANREDVVIATKFGNPMGPSVNARGYSRKHVVDAVDASLRRLGVDHIDLYQTHIWDPTANLEELMRALDDLVRAGKVLYLGATDLPVWQLAKAHYTAAATGAERFTAVQHHYSAVWREDERELLPMCRAEGLGLLPYSPLARGFLAGADRATTRARTDEYTGQWYGRPADAAVRDAVAAVAARTGTSPAQVALGWVLHALPQATPLVGATTVEQLDQAVAALDLTLSPDDITEINTPYLPRPRAGH
jgi:1-deoxyxylulose-5-phosphate synthase